MKQYMFDFIETAYGFINWKDVTPNYVINTMRHMIQTINTRTYKNIINGTINRKTSDAVFNFNHTESNIGDIIWREITHKLIKIFDFTPSASMINNCKYDLIETHYIDCEEVNDQISDINIRMGWIHTNTYNFD